MSTKYITRGRRILSTTTILFMSYKNCKLSFQKLPNRIETLYVHRNTNILITDIIRNYNRMRFLNAIITCHNNYFTMEFRLRLQVQSGCIKQTITHSSFTKTNWSVRRQNVAWAGISLALWMTFLWIIYSKSFSLIDYAWIEEIFMDNSH